MLFFDTKIDVCLDTLKFYLYRLINNKKKHENRGVGVGAFLRFYMS
jgi:hypothetical protein